jgi:predicted glycogen debranching enzyme
MPHEKNVAIVAYKIRNKNNLEAKMRIFPLINGRHFHSVTDRWRLSWKYVQEPENEGFTAHFGVPESLLLVKSTGGRYHAEEKWIERVYYREEAARGESSLDDCYQPGYFEADIPAGKSEDFALMALAEHGQADAQRVSAQMLKTVDDVETLYAGEVGRCENLLTRLYEAHTDVPGNDWLSWIVLASNAFIVRGTSDVERTVIAGYHWFEAWGRDAFVSFPGLMLITGRFDDARKVFLTFMNHCKDGLIPNFIPDEPELAVYNSVDATLWFLNAVLQYVKYTNDFRFVQEQLWEELKSIMESHVAGTASCIRMASDCLLSHGDQLTWMDAVVDGQPVTPRFGEAVEVQALWYNALKTMGLLADKFDEKAEAGKYLRTAEKAREGFVEKFWNPEKNCLFDVVSESGKDASLRPNQIIAVALDFSMLDGAMNEKIVDTVHRELLTPCGLRTLARSDPRYAGVYAGDRGHRDAAYHNGTVWPWLLGPFTTAFLKAKAHMDFTHDYALKNFLSPLFTEQVFRGGLGFVGEIFDGDPPHTPRGCIAQAWSVAEPLRAYVEDVMRVRPKYEGEVLRDLR